MLACATLPAKALQILTESAGRHGLVCEEPAAFAVLEDFGDSGLVFNLYFWLDPTCQTSPAIITSDLRLMIEKRLSEAGMGVPFPQRDVHLTSVKPLQVQWLGSPPLP